MLVRKLYYGDPPPADPPEVDVVWDRHRCLWMESDASLRRRVLASLAEEDDDDGR